MKARIIVVNENTRLYTPEYGVPTLQLGDGGTAVSDIHTDEGLHGVCFSESPRNEGVGFDFTPEHGGKRTTDVEAYFQILTDNQESIDVLIDKLEKAKLAIAKG